MPGEFKIVYGNRNMKYEMHTGWEIGTMALHLETHGILKDSGISLNQTQISEFPRAKPGQVCFL